MNPTNPNYYQDPRIAEAQAKAKSTQETYASAAANDITLPDLLKSALTKKFSTDNPLIRDIEGARTDVLNSFTGSQASVLPQNNNGMIFSPTQQADLIQRYRSPSVSRLSTLNDLFGLNVGGIQNVVGETSRASQAQTALKKGAADSAQNDLKSLLDLLELQQGQANYERDFAENQRQFNVSQSNKTGGESQSKTGEKWQDLINNSANEYQIWEAINVNSTAWRAAGIDVSQIWKNHANLVSKVGKGGAIPDALRTEKGVLSQSTAQLAKNKKNEDQIKEGFAAIQRAKQAIAKSGSGMQYLGYSTRSKLSGPLGLGTDAAKTNAALSNVNTLLFQIAGTQFPKNEEALLGGIVTGLDKDIKTNEQSLNDAQQRLNDRYASVRGIDPSALNALRSGGYNEDQIYEYLNTK